MGLRRTNSLQGVNSGLSPHQLPLDLIRSFSMLGGCVKALQRAVGHSPAVITIGTIEFCGSVGPFAGTKKGWRNFVLLRRSPYGYN